MSEVLHLPEAECARARGMLSQFVDGELTEEQSAWLDGHRKACAECGAALARFVAGFIFVRRGHRVAPIKLRHQCQLRRRNFAMFAIKSRFWLVR